jgi:hypothetical protein
MEDRLEIADEQITTEAHIHNWSSDAYARFNKLEPLDLVKGLRYRFDVEHISRYFSYRSEYSFKGSDLEIDDTNSILIEFTSLQSEYLPQAPPKNYRLLLLFGLNHYE